MSLKEVDPPTICPNAGPLGRSITGYPAYCYVLDNGLILARWQVDALRVLPGGSRVTGVTTRLL